MRSFIKQVWKVGGIYFIWSVLHFSSIHLYQKFCTPFTISGFISSPFLVTTPHCRAFRWCIKNGADALNSMWVIFGTWVINFLT